MIDGPDRLECTSNNVNVSPSLRVVVGSTFSISCTADSKPPPSTFILSGPGGYNLPMSFTGITRTQAGSYSVEAMNNPPSVPTLRVNGTAVQGTVNIIKGNSKVFNCSTDSNPASSYSWTYPRGSSGISTLRVANFLHSTDDGDYTCTVQNRMISSFGSFQNGVNMTTITMARK
ncbi:OBCAM-like protein [Mya arenaria]|uniref:OBCAM-like protein n=1 Tax=Mya arenaria TaxID=6604 RepID=A0ABY7G8G3_MYAAR|nr:OBCAM-like protein [Mya arenaria]